MGHYDTYRVAGLIRKQKLENPPLVEMQLDHSISNFDFIDQCWKQRCDLPLCVYKENKRNIVSSANHTIVVYEDKGFFIIGGSTRDYA